MTSVVALLFLLAAVVTLGLELSGSKFVTPTVLLTVGNVAYFAVNPIVCLFSPDQARYFVYIVELGSQVTDEGLRRLLLCGTLFQLGCLAVSLLPRSPAASVRMTDEEVRPMIRLGLVNVGIGLVGVVLLGFAIGGSPLGLYTVDYHERSLLVWNAGPYAFLVDVGKYGVSMLIAAYVFSNRWTPALVAFLALVMHGVATKSKLPVFHAAAVMVVAASLTSSLIRLRSLLIIAFAGLLLSTLSIIRGAQYLSDLPGYLESNEDAVSQSMSRPWESDLPGPAAGTYYVVNDPDEQLTPEPLIEIVTYFIPRVVYDRGLVLADRYAMRMLRNDFKPGLGMGWSLINDGFLVLGYAGVLLIGVVLAFFGWCIDRLRGSGAQTKATLYLVVAAPLLLFAPRNSLAGVIKVLTIVYVVSILPQALFTRGEAAAERKPAAAP